MTRVSEQRHTAERTGLLCDLHPRILDEGLDQQFNSLQAQREPARPSSTLSGMQAGCAYPLVMTTVASPTRRWIAPALQRLLADIAARRVDVVVVYKIDRLTNLTADKLLVHSHLPLGA